MLALKAHRRARAASRDGRRPAVLYSSTQHAREWIANEVNRRLMNQYIDGWRANDPEIKKLLKTTELWFVLVANPDGYEYTFDVERLWRKNLRDNNGDGQITVGDGVDPNRNFPNHFKYDEEGSSSITSSETYRGPAAASEPETQAMKGLLDRIGFEFQVNYHSNGQWLLYAEGWQIAHADRGRPDLLRPLRQPRPAGDPGLPPRPELRRPVRHQRRDDGLRPCVRRHAGVDARAVGRAARTAGSCSRTTTRSCRRSSSATCRSRCPWPSRRTTRTTRSRCSASRPSRSTRRATTRTRTGIPGVDFEFAYSYGDPQPVQVLAKRELGAGHAQVPHQRRGRAERSDVGVGRRRAVHAGRRLLPRDARRGDRHQPGRLRRGVVRGRR